MFIAFAAVCGNQRLFTNEAAALPDISGDRVVFTYGGDLDRAIFRRCSASRLTSHPGMEVFGKFSPDGKWIAFTGQYDGDEQVYVVAAGGGVPRQLTFIRPRDHSRRAGVGTTRCLAGAATGNGFSSARSVTHGPADCSALLRVGCRWTGRSLADA